jgi:hypothetical protein
MIEVMNDSADGQLKECTQCWRWNGRKWVKPEAHERPSLIATERQCHQSIKEGSKLLITGLAENSASENGTQVSVDEHDIILPMVCRIQGQALDTTNPYPAGSPDASGAIYAQFRQQDSTSRLVSKVRARGTQKFLNEPKPAIEFRHRSRGRTLGAPTVERPEVSGNLTTTLLPLGTRSAPRDIRVGGPRASEAEQSGSNLDEVVASQLETGDQFNHLQSRTATLCNSKELPAGVGLEFESRLGLIENRIALLEKEIRIERGDRLMTLHRLEAALAQKFQHWRWSWGIAAGAAIITLVALIAELFLLPGWRNWL